MRGMPQQAPAQPRHIEVTPAERAAKLIGRIVSFFPTTGAVHRCLRLPNTPRFAGQIISATEITPTNLGAIPDFEVTIRGRTGRTATVSLTENFVSIHDNWTDAQNT